MPRARQARYSSSSTISRRAGEGLGAHAAHAGAHAPLQRAHALPLQPIGGVAVDMALRDRAPPRRGRPLSWQSAQDRLSCPMRCSYCWRPRSRGASSRWSCSAPAACRATAARHRPRGPASLGSRAAAAAPAWWRCAAQVDALREVDRPLRSGPSRGSGRPRRASFAAASPWQLAHEKVMPKMLVPQHLAVGHPQHAGVVLIVALHRLRRRTHGVEARAARLGVAGAVRPQRSAHASRQPSAQRASASAQRDLMRR